MLLKSLSKFRSLACIDKEIPLSFQATACNVMIASPGDVQIERNIVRELIYEWNTVNAAARECVLLPVGWETHSTPLMGERPQSIINWQVLKDSDLLIATFWTRLGTPTGNSESGTVEEIEEHIKAGKPVLIYFSAAPVTPDSIEEEQYKALRNFKDKCKQRGLLETYESSTDFREKVRRHLSITMNSHPYFQSLTQASAYLPSDSLPISATPVPSLSREAIELLLEAVAGDGNILVIAYLGGSTVQANGKNFVEPDNPRSRAVWEGAVDELVNEGLLQSVGYKGEVFRVTRAGFDAADLLKN